MVQNARTVLYQLFPATPPPPKKNTWTKRLALSQKIAKMFGCINCEVYMEVPWIHRCWHLGLKWDRLLNFSAKKKQLQHDFGIKEGWAKLKVTIFLLNTHQKTNMTMANHHYIFKWLVFHCHVSFPGCHDSFVSQSRIDLGKFHLFLFETYMKSKGISPKFAKHSGLRNYSTYHY